jgi:hypothetical protein
MSSVAHALFTALYMAFAMGWEILWPLILGFALSGVIQAVVTKAEMSRLLPDSSPRSNAPGATEPISKDRRIGGIAYPMAECPPRRTTRPGTPGTIRTSNCST